MGVTSMADSIPLEWIQTYNNKLLEIAGRLPVGDLIRDAQLRRVDYILDMVAAWKETKARDQG